MRGGQSRDRGERWRKGGRERRKGKNRGGERLKEEGMEGEDGGGREREEEGGEGEGEQRDRGQR